MTRRAQSKKRGQKQQQKQQRRQAVTVGADVDLSERAADAQLRQSSAVVQQAATGSTRKRSRSSKKDAKAGDGGSRLISDDNRDWLRPVEEREGGETDARRKKKSTKQLKKGRKAPSSSSDPSSSGEDEGAEAAPKFAAKPRKSVMWDDSDASDSDSASSSSGIGDDEFGEAPGGRPGGNDDSSSSDSDSSDSVDAIVVDTVRQAAQRKTQMWDSSDDDDDDDSGSQARLGGVDDVDSPAEEGSDSGQEWLAVDNAGRGGDTGAGWSDVSSDSDSDDSMMGEDSDEFTTPLERKAARAQRKAARVAAEAEAELDEQLRRKGKRGDEDDSGLSSDDEGPKMIKLPSGAGVLESALAPVDISEINARMQHSIRVLANFSQNREGTRSRADYLSELADLMATYFGYSDFLVEKFLELFGPAECLQFMEANEQPRPVTIRVNTLKSRPRDVQNALSSRGATLEQINWCAVGIAVKESQIPIGATPDYLAGHYMLQSASSFLPVMALDPQEKERVLDMCSAPGGKTTHIAQLMQNTGLLFANDVNKDRCKALFANIHRLGVRNAVISNCDGREFPRVMGGFDRILLDAPCTGFGVISKDPSVKTQKSQDDLDKMTKEQKELILAAIDSIDHRSKSGGILVYSTCSVSVEENEAVVDYALKKRHIQILDTGLEFGVPGMTKYLRHRFHPSLHLSRRYYPHTHNLDGFFVCKIKKLSDAAGPGAQNQEAKGKQGGSSKVKRSVVPDVRVGPKKLKVKRKERKEREARQEAYERSRLRNERKALRKQQEAEPAETGDAGKDAPAGKKKSKTPRR